MTRKELILFSNIYRTVIIRIIACCTASNNRATPSIKHVPEKGTNTLSIHALKTFRIRKKIALLALIGAIILLAKAGWIGTKAIAAQILIANAWQETLKHNTPHKPWHWADTWPVAAITTPEGKKLYVLASASGQSLAFGPGLIAPKTHLDKNSHIIIAGHRDTHFAFLEKSTIGDIIQVQTASGTLLRYQIQSFDIVDTRQKTLNIKEQTAELTLITCYPFHALNAGGPLRYIAHAKQLSQMSIR